MSGAIFAVHAQHVVNKYNKRQDVVAVKEVTENANGERVRNLRFFENYKRDFYVTKPKFQNHNEKKLEEDVRKCKRYQCTQAALVEDVGRALRKKSRSIKELASSQYLYGTDLHVTSTILNKYREKFGPPKLMPDVAVMDYEWDVDTKVQKASIGTYGFNDDIHLTIREDKLAQNGLTVKQYLTQIHDGFKQHVLPIVEAFYQSKQGKHQIKRNFKLHVDVVRLDIDVIRKLFEYTHKYKSDYLAFWNGISDLTVIKEHCERYTLDMADFMCDPNVPAKWRVTKVNEGPRGAKLDAKGNKKRIDYFNEWHTLTNIAHWQYVDIMHAYAASRMHKPNLPTYGMDFILTKDLGLGKLKLVPEVSDKDMGKWHITMSNNHIVEYSLYATFDVIGPILLEDKQKEIAVQFYSIADINPIADAKKNPRCLTTKYHFELEKRGLVCASTSKTMVTEIDKQIYSGDDWIITLNSNYHDGIGVSVTEDAPSSGSLFVPNSYDQDLTNSYPMNQRMMNASKTTTYTEMCSIKGMSEENGRMFGLNLSAGIQNAMLLCTECLELPSLLDMIKENEETS